MRVRQKTRASDERSLSGRMGQFGTWRSQTHTEVCAMYLTAGQLPRDRQAALFCHCLRDFDQVFVWAIRRAHAFTSVRFSAGHAW